MKNAKKQGNQTNKQPPGTSSMNSRNRDIRYKWNSANNQQSRTRTHGKAPKPRKKKPEETNIENKTKKKYKRSQDRKNERSGAILDLLLRHTEANGSKEKTSADEINSRTSKL